MTNNGLASIITENKVEYDRVSTLVLERTHPTLSSKIL